MIDKFVFLTGMFRSGTTLLARMLNAHPKITIASDPYFQLFKAFRNIVAEEALGADNVDYEAPLDDYYFYPEKQELMTRIQKTSLALPVGHLQLSVIRQQIANASSPYSPKIGPLLDVLQGKTFADLLVSGLNIIKHAYGNSETQILGFKEVWTDEFAGHVLRQFPEAKVIHIIRDPRAVCASNNVTMQKYPWIFLARQWRKLVTFAWKNNQQSFSLNDHVLLVRFEELITNPLEQTQRMCEFLEIGFNENLVDPTSFINGDGSVWLQNSSHFRGKQEFNLNSLNKWQDVLTPIQVKFIESLCFAEMLAFDYQFTELDNLQTPLLLVFTPPELLMDELASWIRPYSLVNSNALIQEMGMEYMRNRVLLNHEIVSNNEKRLLCLNETFFDAAQHICRQWKERL